MNRLPLIATGLLLCLVIPVRAEEEDKPELRPLHVPGQPYRTPRSGEGFRTTVFGEDIEVEPRDRRSVSAWDLGVAGGAPGADEAEILPFASLYLWRRPNEDTLFRGVIVAVYNEILFAHSPESFGPFEWIATLNTNTIPVEQGELVDGIRVDEEELYWGTVNPGIGFGYRRQVDPGEPDSMLAVGLLFEPGFSYYARGSDTADNFVIPNDTFEPRGRLRMRWDALERNLLELPHTGFALGSDLVYGYRVNWDAWGLDGSVSGDEGRDYLLFGAYAMGATGVPFVDSDRHRLFGSVHAYVSEGADRFSTLRIGGGPQALGEEYGSQFRPVLPGASIDEYYPENYAAANFEYRWEAAFFTYLSVRGAVAYLDRDRRRGDEVRREDGLFTALGGRVTTGFLWNTRLQLDYFYNFNVARRNGYGSHEVVMHISKDF